MVALEAEYDGWREVQFASNQVLEAIRRSGIVGPDLDPTVQICVRRAEEASTGYCAQQSRRLLKRINLVCHAALGLGLLHLKRDNWKTEAQVGAKCIHIKLRGPGRNDSLLLVPTERCFTDPCRESGCSCSCRAQSQLHSGVEVGFEIATAIAAKCIAALCMAGDYRYAEKQE